MEITAGKKYGKLTVLHKACQNKYLCACDCGNTIEVFGYHLVSGNTKSCGCLKDTVHVGEKYGKLTVLEKSDRVVKNGPHYWKCKCDCGNIVEVLPAALRDGRAKSCGCIRNVVTIGKRFGNLLVAEKVKTGSNKACKSICKCDCGNTVEFYNSQLISGYAISCGCIPNGKLKVNDAHVKEVFAKLYIELEHKEIFKKEMAKKLNISRPTLDKWIREQKGSV